MITIKKSFLSAALLAIAASILAPAEALAVTGDVPELQVLNTSSLFYYNNTKYSMICVVSNISTSTVNVLGGGLDQNGTVVGTTGTSPYMLGGGRLNAIEATDGGAYVRCRVRTSTPSLIRADLLVFMNNADNTNQIIATSEAR